MAAPRDKPVLVGSYTILLFVLTALFGYGVFMIQDFMDSFGSDFARVAVYVRNYQIAMTAICLVTASLRSLGASVARIATAITSVLLALVIPAGTICFFYWLLKVRPEELPTPESAD